MNHPKTVGVAAVVGMMEIFKINNMTGIELIEAERKRQIEKEGFDKKHDMNMHMSDDLAIAGAIYALPTNIRLYYYNSRPDGETELRPMLWPFDMQWYKPCPNDRKRELVKAGALIAAEIDRIIDRENYEQWVKENEKDS